MKELAVAVAVLLGWCSVARVSFQGVMKVDDHEIQNSEVRRLFTGLTLRRSLQFPWWDATLSGGQDMVFGDNLARAGFAWTLGVQRNFL